MEQESQHNRRHYQRFRCEGKADIRAESSAGARWGTVTDLSGGGCYIETPAPLQVGETAHLTLTFQDVSITANARVTVVHPMFGMGLVFTACPPPELEKLEGVLAQLSGGERVEVLAGNGGTTTNPTPASSPEAEPASATPVAPAGNGNPAVLRISTQAAYSILDQVIKHLSQKGTLSRAEMLAILKQNQSS
jgi:hypothetical protein